MRLFRHGILGMNARNLRYIKEHNSPDSISLADSKLKTKNFLGSRGIPFAETYSIISSYEELKKFDFNTIRNDYFVIKPNKGSGGRGILIVEKKGGEFLIAGELWSEKEIRLHMLDIIHGSYSINGGSDTVVIEEQILPGGDFSHFCKYGLADIRIIVYNLVPVSAMVRMPSLSSGGKANLAQGGIGVGLNIANGEVMNIYKERESYFQVFPEEYQSLKKLVLPFWDNILLYSSQIQLFTKLGYLALDWVITKNGPKLLEINARAGLEIQNVNRTPLASRLKKIEDLKIQTPEKGVEIAKSLFQPDPISPTPEKDIIHLVQKCSVEGVEMLLKSDPHSTKTRVSRNIIKQLSQKVIIETSTGVIITLTDYEIADDGEDSLIILGSDILQYYLLDTSPEKRIRQYDAKNKWQNEIIELDREVHMCGKKINLSSFLKPDNYSDELHKYMQAAGEYNPHFIYHFPDVEKFEQIKKEINLLQKKAYTLKQSGLLIAELYVEKLEEIENKLHFLVACAEENYGEKYRYNEALFGKTDEKILMLAREKSLNSGLRSKEKDDILGRILDTTQIIALTHAYFESHNLMKVPIVVESGNLSRMSVTYGKQVKIHISKDAIIRQNELEAVLSHEIGTHLRRYFAGKELGLKLFEYGTGYYLSDEEGLAVYRSISKLPEGFEKNSM
ncbi:DUF1704 domain-containing protein, partial [Candidatus Gracilibacteria bacterium]|nr:DUF1704 domain-containing protein [Candidatus Gracilibacteria bacterium]